MLLFRGPAQLDFRFLNFLDRKFGGVQASRNLRIQVAPDKSAERHRGHDPEGHAGDPSEFERGVQRDDQGRRRPQDHVEIQPVARISLLSQPAPSLAQRIEENHEKHEHAEHAQVYANRAARAQQGVFG